MINFFLNILSKLFEDPRPGALLSGTTIFGGYGTAKCSTMLGTTMFEMDFIQTVGVISMAFGMLVGLVTLIAALARIKADRAKKKYYDTELKRFESVQKNN